MRAHFILKLWGRYFWMKLYTYPMLFHNISRLPSVNPCNIGYTCANCVIKQKQLQAMLVNTLSNNNYQHIMRVLVYFWVEIPIFLFSFALNSQIANTLWFLQNVNEVQPSWNDVFNFKWNFTHSNFINDERKENVHCLFWKK